MHNSVLCRDCFGSAPPIGHRCAKCGGPRLVIHPELFDLSVVHIDCDAFYAAVEKRDNPALADRPVIIGGGRRGVVAAACYVARTFGIRSAMPMFKALKACPHAVVIPPDMAKYAAVGRQVRNRMLALTPAVEPLSIDEAFLDLSGTERLHGAPPALVIARFQAEIERELGISVSVGLSHNKFLAKVASDLDKPRGFAVIGRAETLSFLGAPADHADLGRRQGNADAPRKGRAFDDRRVAAHGREEAYRPLWCDGIPLGAPCPRRGRAGSRRRAPREERIGGDDLRTRSERCVRSSAIVA